MAKEVFKSFLKEIILIGDRALVPYLYDEGYLEMRRENAFGQVFSHIESDTGLQRHYDVNKLMKIAIENFTTIDIGQITLLADKVLFIRTHSGIEQARLERLTPSDLEIPGLIVHLSDETDIIVDGNHRAVRRFELGLKTMNFLVLSEAQAKPALLALPEAMGSDLALAGQAPGGPDQKAIADLDKWVTDMGYSPDANK